MHHYQKNKSHACKKFVNICWQSNIYEQDKFRAQLSWAWKKVLHSVVNEHAYWLWHHLLPHFKPSSSNLFENSNVKQSTNIARIEQSSHTLAVVIRGCDTFREKIKLWIKDFIILNQVVAEKTVMKNVYNVLYRSDRRKNLKIWKKKAK